MTGQLTILGIPGSLRIDSYNVAILKSAAKLTPAGVVINLSEKFFHLPLSYYDVNSKNIPDSVAGFKKEIKSASAILFSIPQYNYSYPAIIKNAIDWAQKPEGTDVFTGKIFGIIGACLDTLGTREAVNKLRQALTDLKAGYISDQLILVDTVKDKFNDQKELIDKNLTGQITKLLTDLSKHAFSG